MSLVVDGRGGRLYSVKSGKGGVGCEEDKMSLNTKHRVPMAAANVRKYSLRWGRSGRQGE